MSQHILDINQVIRAYEKGVVVGPIHLRVKKGEIIGLTGNSGEGKTTLLRLIAGLDDVTSGEIIFQGERIIGPSEVLVPGHEDIRTVFQDYKLSPNLNVIDNVKVALRGFVSDYKETRAQELLQFLGLWAFRSYRVHELSGGQKQRLAIARGLAEEPALLLLDEPFSNLDATLRLKFLNELKVIASNLGTTIIFVTHNPLEVLALADRVAFMQKGKIVQCAPPVEVYSRPVNEGVGSFFGPGLWFKNKFIRPEHLILNEGEEKGKVLNCTYIGERYLIELKSGNRLFYAYSDFLIEKNKSIIFKIGI